MYLQVGRDISLELSFPSGNSIFRLDADKVLHLTETLDRDQGDLSSVVFQVSNISAHFLASSELFLPLGDVHSAVHRAQEDAASDCEDL